MRILIYLAYTFFLLIVSCTKDVGPVNHGDYPPAIGRLITRYCSVAGCHNAASYKAAASLNLETWSSLFAGAGSGSPVIPFSSKFSSLCYFINTYNELGIQNKPTMPINGNKLAYDDVKRIKDWIDEGAPDINGKIKWLENPQRKKLYAVNQGCDVVTVFDSETQLPIRYVDVGTKPGPDVPHQVRVSPDGDYWYVVFINNNIMQKFRCSDDSYVGSIPLTPFAAGQSADPQSDATDWNTFVISRDGKRAYCASWTQNGKVAAVDLENRRLLHYQPAFYYSHGIALNATEDKIYVTSQPGNFITMIDTGFVFGTNQLSLEKGAQPNFSSSLDPHDIILSPDGKNFLITCQKSNEVRVFNIATNMVEATIPTGAYPQEIVYSKTFRQYFVSCTNDEENGANGSVMRIEETGYNSKKLICGYQPHGLAVDENKQLLYVLSRNVSSGGPPSHHSSQCQGKNGFVNFVDLNTYLLLPKKYEMSVDPYYIAARP